MQFQNYLNIAVIFYGVNKPVKRYIKTKPLHKMMFVNKEFSYHKHVTAFVMMCQQ